MLKNATEIFGIGIRDTPTVRDALFTDSLEPGRIVAFIMRLKGQVTATVEFGPQCQKKGALKRKDEEYRTRMNRDAGFATDDRVASVHEVLRFAFNISQKELVLPPFCA